jgi:hypothetical protein
LGEPQPLRMFVPLALAAKNLGVKPRRRRVVKNNKAAVLKTLRIMPRAGQQATRAGLGAARREVQKHKPPRGLRNFQQNFELPWARLFQRTRIAPPVTSHHRTPQFCVRRRSDFL